jgi:formylglycine-generating enzyme required for sulfatase activity
MYAGSDTPGNVAWCNSSVSTTQPVGQKVPNELGLYDMSGNVWEWCNDYSGLYSDDAQTNPTGPESGSSRICRGGAFFNPKSNSRVWYRTEASASQTANGLGFRLAL